MDNQEGINVELSFEKANVIKGSATFLDQKPFVVAAKHMKLPWSGGKDGVYFRCCLCGYRFQVGDVARWQYTNDVSGAGGNPLVCQACDGTKEQIVDKWKKMNSEAHGRMWWFCRGPGGSWRF